MRATAAADSFPFFDNDGRPLAFAHRGGARLPANAGIENSMAAFQSAIDLGYRYLETDVHATSDGRLVAFHDHSLSRVTDGQGLVAKLPYASLREVRIGGREPIPLLSELLDAWPDARFNIDCKAAGAIRPLVETIDRHRAWDRVCIASFSARRLALLRRLLGDRVATSYAAVGSMGLRLIPAERLARVLLERRAQAAQLPTRVGRLPVVTARVVERAHLMGKQVHAWTVDDPDEMRLLLDLGVDGIMTDRSDLLREVLRTRGSWN